MTEGAIEGAEHELLPSKGTALKGAAAAAALAAAAAVGREFVNRGNGGED